MSYLAVPVFAAALAASYLLGYTPLVVPAIYLVLSLLALLTYARDKSAARNGAWRVPERTLHCLALLGGWPGALIAQHRFRHKTRKIGFRVVFWMCVTANCAGLAWLHVGRGAMYMHTLVLGLADMLASALESGYGRDILLLLFAYHA